jgi:predicted deacylase
MQLKIGFIGLALLSLNSFAQIQEQWLVKGSLSSSTGKILSSHPEIIVDHVHSESFEVYGPKGVGAYLESMGLELGTLAVPQKNKNNEADYPSFGQNEQKLRDLAARFPQLVKMFSIGKSVQGRDLWVMKISDNVQVDETEPEVKYISSMHGDEITGRELMMKLVDELLTKYSSDASIKALIDNTEIFIMPSMNPDGSELRQRGNANNRDLNRNFPDFTNDPTNTTANRQPEVQAVMAFQASRKFALSANFHGGSVVVNYPWDTTYDLHPLDQLVREISVDYASLNAPMRNSREFDQGVTNGAQWYVVKGGMQDWSYHWYNDLQVTVELSDDKWPNYNQIPQFYADNKASLLAYLKRVHQGAGFKLSQDLSGTVEIQSSRGSLGSFPFSGGEFYKVLEEGAYTFKIKAGAAERSVEVQVNNSIKSNGNFETIILGKL